MFFKRSKSAPASDIDSRLAAFDQSYAGLFPDDPRPWDGQAAPAAPKRPFLGKTRWWWFSRITAALLLLFILVILWLAVTAPLSKSLQPIAPPRITLLASDGTPIARNGAIVDKPVDVSTLPPHVAQAFLSIEDRRFYSHWGIDPRGLGARRLVQRFWQRHDAGREHDHPATGQIHLLDPRTQPDPQGRAKC